MERHFIVFVILVSVKKRFNTKGVYKLAGNWLRALCLEAPCDVQSGQKYLALNLWHTEL